MDEQGQVATVTTTTTVFTADRQLGLRTAFFFFKTETGTENL